MKATGKNARKRKGHLHGVAMMGWLFFANLFDPKKIASVEQIESDRQIGNPALRQAGTAAAPPPDRH